MVQEYSLQPRHCCLFAFIFFTRCIYLAHPPLRFPSPRTRPGPAAAFFRVRGERILALARHCVLAPPDAARRRIFLRELRRYIHRGQKTISMVHCVLYCRSGRTSWCMVVSANQPPAPAQQRMGRRDPLPFIGLGNTEHQVPFFPKAPAQHVVYNHLAAYICHYLLFIITCVYYLFHYLCIVYYYLVAFDYFLWKSSP